MATFFFRNREKDKAWKRHIAVHIIGLILCLTILVITVVIKFEEGGWLTLLITSGVIVLCYLIRRHYTKVRRGVRQLEEILSELPKGSQPNNEPLDTKEATAILLVRGYSGFGLHVWLSVVREFPKLYKNFIFVSVGEIDSGSFKGIAEIDALKKSVESDLTKYVRLVRSYGFPADYRMEIGTDVADTATGLCESLVKEFPRSTVFTGKLIFREENPFQKLLHNETAFAIQRRLQWNGITTVILPIRVDI
jgi:K+ transporter